MRNRGHVFLESLGTVNFFLLFFCTAILAEYPGLLILPGTLRGRIGSRGHQRHPHGAELEPAARKLAFLSEDRGHDRSEAGAERPCRRPRKRRDEGTTHDAEQGGLPT